jgi:hypothetical protein
LAAPSPACILTCRRLQSSDPRPQPCLPSHGLDRSAERKERRRACRVLVGAGGDARGPRSFFPTAPCAADPRGPAEVHGRRCGASPLDQNTVWAFFVHDTVLGSESGHFSPTATTQPSGWPFTRTDRGLLRWVWVRGLPFPNARHLGHPFQWKNTLPWHLGPTAKVRILPFRNLPPFRHYRGLQNHL